MTRKELLKMLDCQKRICREWGECDGCPGGRSCRKAEEKIRALIKSSGKRTVSREAVDGIWNDIKERGRYGLVVCLQELGFTIEEPKGGEEED